MGRWRMISRQEPCLWPRQVMLQLTRSCCERQCPTRRWGMVVASCETVACMCGHGRVLVRFSQVACKLFASRYFGHGAALVRLSQVACKPSSRRFSDGSLVVASSFESVPCMCAQGGALYDSLRLLASFLLR